MNTKSMVLILNGLLLFNTASHGFSISSWRKKAVEMCTKIGKKSIAVVCVIVLALLNTLNVKAGEYLASKVRRAAHMDYRYVHPLPQNPPLRPPIPNPPVPVDPQPSQEVIKLPRAPVPVTFATIAAAAGSSGARLLNTVQTLSFDEDSAKKEDPLDELDQSIERRKQRLEQIEKQKQATIEKFEYVLDDIRNKRYQLHKPYSRDPLPLELQGTMLKLLPKEIVATITQLLHYESFYHERSFYVPVQYSEPEFLEGKTKKPSYYYYHQRSTLNFIDGDPNKLELATCVPLPKDSNEYHRYKHVDSIIIDTTTCKHTVKREEQDYRNRNSDAATSYEQRAAQSSGLYSPHPMELGFNPNLIPLIQQLNFIGDYDFTWTNFDLGSFYSRGWKCYTRRNLSCTDEFDTKGQGIHPFKYGLQRNLKNNKMAWVRPKGEYVGIYEKAQRWFDKSGALQHPTFENESVIHDRTGDEFHLVQVIQEETPIQAISLPHTPVYLTDKDGNELRGCLGYPPGDSTLHLRSPFYFPDRLDALALGFNQTETNNRCSLYKQRGDNVWEYPPSLLAYQHVPLRPLKKTTLYHGEELTWGQSIALQATAAKRIFKSIRGKELPPLD